jgi:predicted nucleic acid-binding protein
MLVLDSTVLIAAMDRARPAHQAARDLLSSTVLKAVTTQTLREALAVATRPMAANGLGLDFDRAWNSISALRLGCDHLLHENERWWTSYTTLAKTIRPAGRSIHDLGQVAHVHSQGKDATLITDDEGMCSRYRDHINVITVGMYRAQITGMDR